MKKYLYLILFLLSGSGPLLRAVAEPATEQPVDESAGQVLLLEIEGMINPATDGWLQDGVDHAETNGFDLVLVQLDTPGGMLESTRGMVQTLLNSKVPVCVFVAPSGAHAASAGMFITLAADLAAMAPGTNIGASTPVDSSGGDVENKGEDLARKVMEDTKALVRSISEVQGRNMEWALAAVTEARSYTAQEAISAGAIDLIANNRGALMTLLAGRSVTTAAGTVTLPASFAPLQPFEPSPAQHFVRWLAHPQVAYLLMMVGMAGLYFELSSPGVILPGVMGGISLLLAFASLNVLPFNVSGLLLLALAMVLLIAEIYVPSGGVLGVGGIAAFVFGSTLLFDRPDLDFGVSPITIGAVALFLFALMLLLGRLVLGAHRQRTLTGFESLIGQTVLLEKDLPDRGNLLIQGELWTVRHDEAKAIPTGTHIEVVAKEGIYLRICPVAEQNTLGTEEE